jgi:hypothetical protein
MLPQLVSAYIFRHSLSDWDLLPYAFGIAAAIDISNPKLSE